MTAVRRYASWMLVSVAALVAACSVDGRIDDQTRQSRGEGAEERGVKVKGVRTIKLDAPRYGTIMAWSPDSQRLAVGGSLDRRVTVWDVRTGQRLPGPGDQQGGPQALVYSPDGRYLAVARGGVRFRGDVPVPTNSERYVVSLWDAQTGAWIQNLVDETQEIATFFVTSMAFSPDSKLFAANYSGGLAFYSRDGAVWRRSGDLAPRASRIAFSPDGTRLIGTTGDEVLVYEIPGARIMARWPGLRTGIEIGYRSLAYRPDGRQIAIGEGRQLGFFDPTTGVLVYLLEPSPPYEIKGLSYSQSSRYVALGVASNAQFIEADNFSRGITLTEHHQNVEGLSLSPDGTLLAAVGGPVITLWEVSGL